MGSTIFWLLIFAIVVFCVYAFWTKYGAQPTEQSKAMRMWGALLAAAASLGAVVMSWFSTPTP